MSAADTRPASQGAVGRLSLIAASVGFGQSALLALVPIVVERTGLGPSAIGAVTLLGAMAFLVAAPLWGHLGARTGLRRLFRQLAALMIAGHALLVAAVFLGPLPTLAALALLAVSRVAYSVGAAGVMPHAQAAIVHGTALDRRPAALSRLSAGLGVGRVLGSLAAVAGAAGAGAPFLLMAVSPLLLLGAPDLVRPAAEEGRKRLSSVAAAVLPLLAIAFLLTFGLGQIQMVLGLFLQQRFGQSADQAAALAGVTYALVAVAMIAVQILVVPRLAYRPTRNMQLGVASFAAGSAILAAAPSLWLVTVGAVLAGAGIALATPAYTASLAARVPAAQQAGAAGWLASIHVMGQGIGALAGGASFTLWPPLPFVVCVAAGCIACLVLALSRRPQPAAREPAGDTGPQD
ncbi:MFS transporter [Chelatococcus reniformis]|uniref:MFS transporter n=1 Tax=Chelatococcus reniformis TaxID=1494448 RepID=A0A916UVM3_9HYPH|nr:MFS transporter [Chelatococcus reniformis]GGC88901.1 MFS transporter [Chelatococcus reniformis]